jgi:hypothetical protein
MKTLRDSLIMIVLGGVVIFYAVRFFEWYHRRSLGLNPVVGEAEIACLNDHMVCHVGSDMFSSVEDAQAYLNSPEHLAKVKEREKNAADEAEFERRVNALVQQGKSAVKAACRRDGTLNCDLITDKSLKSFAETLLRERIRQESQPH